MYPYEKGHCILLGLNHYVVKDVKDELAFVVHISDPRGFRGKWVGKDRLPMPIAKIDIDKYD